MPNPALILALLSASLCTVSVGQSGSKKAAPVPRAPTPPVYHVSFERREPVDAVNATGGFQLPFQCTSDGTFFVNFIGTVPAGAGINPPLFPPMMLTSISASGRGHTFRLDQVPELFISRQEDYFVSDSEVIFLIRGARENKPVKRTFQRKDGSQDGYEENAAPQHLYMLSFTRDGEYRRTIEIDDSFSILHVGAFSTGMFLALGFDKKDKSPTLVMLTADGTILKSLTAPAGDLPRSMITGPDAPHPHAIVATELIPVGHSILMLVQNDAAFPLLEVTEGGEIRAIRPKLPSDAQITAVAPSDRNLYVITSKENDKRDVGGAIYELSPEDGAVLGRFELPDGRQGSSVACVHDGKFLSMDIEDGKIIPLVGTAEPSGTAIQ